LLLLKDECEIRFHNKGIEARLLRGVYFFVIAIFRFLLCFFYIVVNLRVILKNKVLYAV
jgi:hypothetical protein